MLGPRNPSNHAVNSSVHGFLCGPMSPEEEKPSATQATKTPRNMSAAVTLVRYQAVVGKQVFFIRYTVSIAVDPIFSVVRKVVLHISPTVAVGVPTPDVFALERCSVSVWTAIDAGPAVMRLPNQGQQPSKSVSGQPRIPYPYAVP